MEAVEEVEEVEVEVVAAVGAAGVVGGGVVAAEQDEQGSADWSQPLLG